MPEQPKKRILIVDDDPTVSEILGQAFPEYEIGVVPDAESALNTADAFQPDLFILDLVLPGMRGTSLALILRDSPSFSQTPVFLLSALIEPALRTGEPVRVQGITAFPKPFKLEILQKHLRLHLEDPVAGKAALEHLERGWVAGE